MSAAAVGAAFRLEVRRRWPLLLFFFVTLLVMAAATPMVRGEAVLLLALPAVLVGMAGYATSWATSSGDRMQGRFEVFRGLPVPLVAVTHGRMLLVLGWALVLPLGVLPAVLALSRSDLLVVPHVVVGGWLGALWLLAATVAIVLTALTARWPLERWLGALFAALYFTALLAWPWLQPVIAPRVAALGTWFLSHGATPRAAGTALVVAGGGLLAVWWPVARLFAWGMAVAPSGTPERAGALARRRDAGPLGYPSGRRGPVAAVASLKLRLAMERLPRQVGVLVAGLLLVPLLSEALRVPALVYLRVLAVAMPAGVIGRLAMSRAEGTLDSLAALPVRRARVAFGISVAIGVLALPAAAVIAAATAVARGGELDPVLLLRSWGALTGSTILGAGLAVWFTMRALRVIGLLVGVALVAILTVITVEETALLPVVLASAEWIARAAGHPVTLVLPLLIGGGTGLGLMTRGLGRLGPRTR